MSKPFKYDLTDAHFRINELEAENAQAIYELTPIVQHFVDALCPTPQWEPLADLRGLISQLSNVASSVALQRYWDRSVEDDEAT